MYDSILVPTDGSDDAEEAITHALGLAEAFDATVHVLYVIEAKPEYLFNVAGVDPKNLEQYQEHAGRIVDEVADRASADGLETVVDVRTGDPAEEIVSYADENDVSLIVMGAHGWNAMDRYLIGSTAEKVVRTATVPVTTVRLD